MPVDHTKPIVHGKVIKCRRRLRGSTLDNEYLVKLDDGQEAWFWEDDLEHEKRRI